MNRIVGCASIMLLLFAFLSSCENVHDDLGEPSQQTESSSLKQSETGADVVIPSVSWPQIENYTYPSDTPPEIRKNADVLRERVFPEMENPYELQALPSATSLNFAGVKEIAEVVRIEKLESGFWGAHIIDVNDKNYYLCMFDSGDIMIICRGDEYDPNKIIWLAHR